MIYKYMPLVHKLENGTFKAFDLNSGKLIGTYTELSVAQLCEEMGKSSITTEEFDKFLYDSANV